LGSIEIYQDTVGADAFMAFHVASDFAAYFGLKGDINDFAVGGWSMGDTYYRLWHSGNDGAGSGLDADLLDGIQGASFLRSDANDSFSGEITMSTQKALIASNYGHGIYGVYSPTRYQHVWSMGTAYNLPADGLDESGPAGNLYGLAWSYDPNYSYAGSNPQAKDGLNHQLLLMMNGTTYTALGNGIWTSGNVTIGGSATISGNTAWHAGNDGAGSGLDADLLDGLDLHTGRNNEGNKVVRTDGSGYIQAGWINTTSGDLGVGTRLDRVYCSNDAYVRYLGLTDFKNQMGLSSKNNYSRRVDYTADSNYWVGSFGHSGYGANETFHGGSGFFDIWSGTNYPGGFTHIHGINMLHYTTNSLGSTGGNAYGWQMATQYSSDAGPYWRRCNGGSFSAWRKIWHDSNDGAGSGLDADTVDGFHGAKINGLAVLGWLG
jgi:hypothetical protein